MAVVKERKALIRVIYYQFIRYIICIKMLHKATFTLCVIFIMISIITFHWWYVTINTEFYDIISNKAHPPFHPLSNDELITIGCDNIYEQIEDSLKSARQTIIYSFFVCDFDKPFGRLRKNMKQHFTDARKRGVKITILSPTVKEYGNQMSIDIKELGDIYMVDPRQELPWNIKLFCDTISHHHQKYLLSDDTIIISGTDINDERTQYPQPNSAGYYWHEISIKLKASNNIKKWLSPPNFSINKKEIFPFVTGGEPEENVMVNMILESQHSIHIEHQIFSTGCFTENKIGIALEQRLIRAFNDKNDPFVAIVITNKVQNDEPRILTRLYAKMTTINSIASLFTRLTNKGVKNPWTKLRFYQLMKDEVIIKIHSNFIISDGYKMVRSSTNLVDRSLICAMDTELGVCVEGPQVTTTQNTLLNSYLETRTQNPLKYIFKRDGLKQMGTLHPLFFSGYNDHYKSIGLAFSTMLKIVNTPLWKRGENPKFNIQSQRTRRGNII